MRVGVFTPPLSQLPLPEVYRVHTEAVRRLGSIEPIPVRGRDEAAFRAALANPGIKAIHICTPSAVHFSMAKAALEAGKHVLCEKPLATSARDAAALVQLAQSKGLRNCTCHNLRYYPMVQHMRRMREDGDLGEILIVQGTYSQDWLLHETDWNWRMDSKQSGPSRALADIGSHWCDMAEHVTGQRITAVCADLQTFHKSRDTEDFGAVVFRMGDRARGTFTASQVSAGRKNRLSIEIYGSKSGVAWDQERPDELWIGNRDTNNQIIIKDPALLKEAARSYADLPGGHSEGYDDTFKQVFRRFYASIEDAGAQPEYPEFADGLRQLVVLEAELESHRRHAWEHVR
jgi:predicted dehydrogenase